jgi:hypothetical protein
MKNIFPNIQSIDNYSNPLFLVQVLNMLTNNLNNYKFNVIYIQDIHTSKIIYHRVFSNVLKYDIAVKYIKEFSSKDCKNGVEGITFIFLKSSPFCSPKFINDIDTLKFKCSFYKRSEVLNKYQTQKLALKGYIISNPDNIDNIINMWNEKESIRLIKG